MKKTITKLLSVALAVIMLVSTTACTSDANLICKDFVKLNYGREDVSEEFIDMMYNFSANLFSQNLNNGQNGLVSPLSALYCLALAANGADGNTLAEIESVLGISIDELNESAYQFASDVYNGKGCSVSLANSIWMKDDPLLNVNDSFLQANADWYNADIYTSSFDNSTKNNINNWVKDNTNGMIDKIIDNIDEDTLIYLFNALAFDAEWEEKYKNSQIKDDIFSNYNGSTANISMMTSKENKYYSYGGAVGFSKNYKGSRYSFVAILPDESVDIYDFASSFDGDFFKNFMSSRINAAVTAQMPEFKFESQNMDLIKSMKAMGINDMFSEYDADFSKLGSYGFNGLYVAKYFQKTYIDVSRNGTKAAAISGIGFAPKAADAPDKYYTVRLDRPFVYAIVDNQTNIPLFVGLTADLG